MMVKLGWGRLALVTAGLGLACAMTACSSTGGDTPTDATATAPTTASPTAVAPSDLPSAPSLSPTPIPVSTSLDGVDATGAFGESPDVTVPVPWAIDTTRVKVLVPGSGITCNGGLTQVNYYGVNARSGDKFDESYSNGSPVTFDLSGGMIAGFVKAIDGQKEGTRLIAAIPGADGYDASGGNTDAGIELGDTLVFVIDIVRCEISQPTGQAVTPTDTSLPTVGGTADAPTLTIPSSNTAPSSLVIQPLIKGEGDPVTADDFVKVNYAEYTWSNGQLVRQTFGFTPLTGMLSATIEGWQTGLLGQTVGSRLLLVVPPNQAYPQGNPSLNIPTGSTMVYLIDIMYAAQS